MTRSYETEWDSEATHQALSIATRERFDLRPENAGIRVAIVNQRWAGCLSHNEALVLRETRPNTWSEDLVEQVVDAGGLLR